MENSNHISSNTSASVIVKTPTGFSILNSSAPPIYATETSYKVEGVLYNLSDNTPLANRKVTVKNDGSVLNTLTTDDKGYFTFKRIFSYGSVSLVFIFEGDTYFDACSIIHDFDVVKHSVEFRDVLIYPSAICGYLIQKETNKPKGNCRVEVNYNGNYVTGVKTDYKGYFMISLLNGGVNNCPRVWNSLEYSGDTYFFNASLDLNKIAIDRHTNIVNCGAFYKDNIFHYTGKLVDGLGNALIGKTVQITSELKGSRLSDAVTDKNGEFSFVSDCDDRFDCYFAGDSNYNASNNKIS